MQVHHRSSYHLNVLFLEEEFLYLMISDNDTCFKSEEVNLTEELTRYKSNGNLY